MVDRSGKWRAVLVVAVIAVVPAASAQASPSRAADAARLASQVMHARSDHARYGALIKVMSALNIGVYSPTGPVVDGAARSIHQIYAYTYELRSLATALGWGDLVTFDQFAAQLTGRYAAQHHRAKLSGRAFLGVVAARVRVAVAHPGARSSLGLLIVRALGLLHRPGIDLAGRPQLAGIQLDALQRELLIADFAVAGEGASGRSADAGSAIEVPNAPCEDVQSNRARKFFQIGQKIVGKIPVISDLLKSLPDFWHATLIGLSLDFRFVPPGSETATHLGPQGNGGDERHVPGRQLVFRVRAALLDDFTPHEVACMKMWGYTVPHDGKAGPIEGVPVTWQPVLTSADFRKLLKYGRVVREQQRTDRNGIAELVVQPFDELYPGKGKETTEGGVIQPSADLFTALGNSTGKLVELVAPRFETISWEVQHHAQWVFDWKVEVQQRSSWNATATDDCSGAGETDVGTQTLRYGNPSPVRLLFSEESDGSMVVEIPPAVSADFSVPATAARNNTHTDIPATNTNCGGGGGGGGGGGTPPPSDCGTRSGTLSIFLQSFLTTDELTLQPDELTITYKNCQTASGGATLPPALKQAPILDDVKNEDLPKLTYSHGDVHDESYNEDTGGVHLQNRGQTTVNWSLTMRRVPLR